MREGLDKLMTELLPCGTALADGAGHLAAANSAARVLLGLDGKDTDAVALTRAGQATSLAELLREHAAGPTLRRRLDVEHPENGWLRLTLTRVGGPLAEEVKPRSESVRGLESESVRESESKSVRGLESESVKGRMGSDAPTLPLSCSSTLPLSHPSTLPLSHSPTLPPSHSPTLPLSHPPTFPEPWVHMVVERGPQRDWRWARHSDPLAVFAHELNNVLAPLREGIELLREGVGGPVTGEQSGLLSGVCEDVARIHRLTETMLAASAARVGRVRVAEGWVGARELVASVGRSFAAPARRAGIELATGEVAAGLGCRGDADLLAQALSNLVANAVKFTPQGGRVAVTARQCEVRGEAFLELAVRDTGTGLGPEEIGRILGEAGAADFRFPSAEVQLENPGPQRPGRPGPPDLRPSEIENPKSKIPGLGIGLTIVRDVAEEHGGRVMAEGEPGVGCCFRIIVPQDFWRSEPWRLRQIANGLKLARAVAVPLSIVEVRVACPGEASWASGPGLVHLPLIEQCLEESLRPSDTVIVCESSATLVLYDVDGPGARRAAHRAVRALARLLTRFPLPYPRSVIGWGVASYPADGATAPALADAAQRNMETLPVEPGEDRQREEVEGESVEGESVERESVERGASEEVKPGTPAGGPSTLHSPPSTVPRSPVPRPASLSTPEGCRS